MVLDTTVPGVVVRNQPISSTTVDGTSIGRDVCILVANSIGGSEKKMNVVTPDNVTKFLKLIPNTAPTKWDNVLLEVLNKWTKDYPDAKLARIPKIKILNVFDYYVGSGFAKATVSIPGFKSDGTTATTSTATFKMAGKCGNEWGLTIQVEATGTPKLVQNMHILDPLGNTVYTKTFRGNFAQNIDDFNESQDYVRITLGTDTATFSPTVVGTPLKFAGGTTPAVPEYGDTGFDDFQSLVITAMDKGLLSDKTTSYGLLLPHDDFMQSKLSDVQNFLTRREANALEFLCYGSVMHKGDTLDHVDIENGDLETRMDGLDTLYQFSVISQIFNERSAGGTVKEEDIILSVADNMFLQVAKTLMDKTTHAVNPLIRYSPVYSNEDPLNTSGDISLAEAYAATKLGVTHYFLMDQDTNSYAPVKSVTCERMAADKANKANVQLFSQKCFCYILADLNFSAAVGDIGFSKFRATTDSYIKTKVSKYKSMKPNSLVNDITSSVVQDPEDVDAGDIQVVVMFPNSIDRVFVYTAKDMLK
jgi:hypothetical protein